MSTQTLENTSEKPSLFGQVRNFFEKAGSATVGAAIGAGVGMLIPIPGASFLGATIGGLIGRGVEAGINSVAGLDKSPAAKPAVEAKETPETVADSTQSIAHKLSQAPKPAPMANNLLLKKAEQTLGETKKLGTELDNMFNRDIKAEPTDTFKPMSPFNTGTPTLTRNTG